ncbi:hypothetical protein LTR10_019802 [Elasticomyces elasticus]|uniref:G-protein coupled receptors family 1 profile domain-containing protein n=1 Tax=Exophiala sideris TaxID=1016849 RepID=A0ABR0JEK4_9EURO|nr:hypothetical protein LTR10_019802 [Elasticomyces elasticus]KAK5061669.1 hypothetical protein LTR69_004851 [Exophiala sideris]KAK5184369.1 hypothetical protein LTR44_003042 [Eurotiomycetes sp. CCFEE 6388]
MKFTTRSVSDAFPISNPNQPTFPPPPQPSRPRHPAIRRLRRFRIVAQPIILVLVFTTFILNAIYAYCVAKLHNSDTTASATTRESSTVTALLFYTLTTPSISILHLTADLLTHHTKPQHLSTKLAYTCLLPTTMLLTAGWLTSVSIWMHCEIPAFNKSGQSVCPPQVRGHFMYGIHEVSIAKTAISWTIFGLYAVYLLILAAGHKAQKRVWRITEKTGADFEHGDATEIVVSV